LHGGSATITPAAMASLQAYDWPGNVRELQNIIERASVLSRGNPIEPEHLPMEFSSTGAPQIPAESPRIDSLALNPAVEHLERHIIRTALEQSGGNKSKAARLMEISERSLWYKIKNYGLE